MIVKPVEPKAGSDLGLREVGENQLEVLQFYFPRSLISKRNSP